MLCFFANLKNCGFWRGDVSCNPPLHKTVEQRLAQGIVTAQHIIDQNIDRRVWEHLSRDQITQGIRFIACGIRAGVFLLFFGIFQNVRGACVFARFNKSASCGVKSLMVDDATGAALTLVFLIRKGGFILLAITLFNKLPQLAHVEFTGDHVDRFLNLAGKLRHF